MSSHRNYRQQLSLGYSTSSREAEDTQANLPPLIFDQDGYDISQSGLVVIPQAFRDITVSQIILEFLRVDSSGMSVAQANKAKNHAILKVDLISSYQEYHGVRISMEPDWEIASTGSDDGAYVSYKPGRLLVKPVRYEGQSNSAARCCWLQHRPGVTIDSLLLRITNLYLHHFCFVRRNERYFGCRDFVAQVLYQWCQAGYSTPTITASRPANPVLPVNNAYLALGMRFMVEPLGQPRACAIDRGHYSSYRRVETSQMPYLNTAGAQQIEQLLSGRSGGYAGSSYAQSLLYSSPGTPSAQYRQPTAASPSSRSRSVWDEQEGRYRYFDWATNRWVWEPSR